MGSIITANGSEYRIIENSKKCSAFVPPVLSTHSCKNCAALLVQSTQNAQSASLDGIIGQYLQ